MVISNFKFPIYSFFIIFSLIIGIIFNYYYLKRKKLNKQEILYFLSFILPFAIIGGLVISKIITGKIGLNSYGGALSLIIASIVYNKIVPNKNIYLKSMLLSLPLIYSIAKLGCFFAGCCYGLPYNGFLSVTYINDLNIPLIPIQLIETICFMIIFFILLLIDKKAKNMIELTIILCATLKFLLDFLRYNHTYEIISKNQIISIILIVISIISLIKKTINNK